VTTARRLAVAGVLAGTLLSVNARATADVRAVWFYNVHTGEELRLRPFARYGRIEPAAWRRLNRFFRSWRTGRRRPVHPRLVRVLAHLQTHFGGRRIEVVSGYRVPEDDDELDSYHQVGRAADVRIVGVPKRALFDYCRELQAQAPLGCGFYPRTEFVHLDVRDQRSGLWVDQGAAGRRRDYVPNPRTWLRRH
jgi:uncharacterized protein YcbK (DUF882 family)